MCSVNMYEAKTNLSKYVEKLENGEEKEIVLCRYGKKVAKIVLFDNDVAKKRLGAGIGILSGEDCDFDNEEINAEIAKEFGY